MMLNMKRFVASMLIMAILAFSAGYAIQNEVLYKQRSSVRGNVYVLIERPEGEALIVGNTLTDLFEDMLADIFGFDNVTTVNATKWIALGNSTVSQTKTKLDTEATTSGFGRAVATSIIKWTYNGDKAINYTKKFTATGNIEINACALHASDTAEAADAVAIASLGGSQAFQANWNCTIVWMIVYNCN